MHRSLAAAIVALLLGSTMVGHAAASGGGALRLHHVQAEGTHNSYHQKPPWSPVITEWDYEHSALDVQAETEGVRQFELDVHYHPDAPAGERFVVFHVAGADEEADCDGDDETDTLVACLEVLRSWSEDNPDHHPIVIHIEPKDDQEADFFDPDAAPITGHYDELDGDIRDALGGDLITPDAVRGGHRTLQQAVTSEGWPRLAETRGAFLVVMLDRGAHRAAYSGYGSPEASLAGRAMFVEAHAGDTGPLSTIFRVDEPRGNEDVIGDLVSRNFLVRTRADANGREPRDCPPFPDAPDPLFAPKPCPVAGEPDFSRLDAALRSGAHFISTDFPHGDRIGNGYHVAIPGGTPSRCNPVSTATLPCETSDVEPGG